MNNTFLNADLIVAIIGIIVTSLIAVTGGIYAIITNTKKYELTESFRQEILEWYSSVVKVMINIIHFCENGDFYANERSSEKAEMLSQLSALAEIGRFYFPNVIKKDGFGNEKPSAYRGTRHVVLEFILQFYFIALKSADKEDTSILWKLEQNFTSFIFEVIKPRKRNKIYSKYLTITIPQGKSLMDFLYENPSNIFIFTKL